MVDGAYVQLTKEQDSLQNITPGELNQPIDVVQLTAPKCPQCGQALPESYQPPATEDWTTGIFGCAEDPNSCWTGLFCPCILFGRNVENLSEEISYTCACVGHMICVEGGITLAALLAAFNGIIDPQSVGLIAEGLLCTWWICGVYTGMARQALQRKYHLKVRSTTNCFMSNMMLNGRHTFKLSGNCSIRPQIIIQFGFSFLVQTELKVKIQTGQ
ncbi:OLC1v1002133C2 [Oldenlandia corymbosa var. corymbosa]|uniref:OLC1v1002133C2 n=1 Tax=Oldenlandia corymbosa var. corymbosa TaxID=529605 RepID=A0AAV1D6X7_OLDCO|nr:OLC1v1002133C2 [Oldenlandia corymbosa var. corymbosa]